MGKREEFNASTFYRSAYSDDRSKVKVSTICSTQQYCSILISMVAAFTSVLIFFAYGTVAIGSWVGAKRLQQKRLRFPHLVSAWWVVILTAIAVIPPMAVDEVMKHWPNPDEAGWIPFEPYLT